MTHVVEEIFEEKFKVEKTIFVTILDFKMQRVVLTLPDMTRRANTNVTCTRGLIFARLIFVLRAHFILLARQRDRP